MYIYMWSIYIYIFDLYIYVIYKYIHDPCMYKNIHIYIYILSKYIYIYTYIIWSVVKVQDVLKMSKWTRFTPSDREASPFGIWRSTGDDALRQVLCWNAENLPLSDGKGSPTTPLGWLCLLFHPLRLQRKMNGRWFWKRDSEKKASFSRWIGNSLGVHRIYHPVSK